MKTLHVLVKVGIAGVLLHGGFACADPVPPDPLVEGLSAETYPERVSAETELRKWAQKHGNSAWTWLLEQSNHGECPEVQERALAVLKESVLGDLSQKRPGFVGITMAPAEVELEEGDGFGVQIRMVSPDSPAEKAGLLPQDVVTELNGKGWDGLDTADSFAARVGKMTPGTKVTLGVLRGGEKLKVEVTLGARPWSAGEYGDQQRLFMQRGGGLMFMPTDEKTAREEAFQKWLEARKPMPAGGVAE